MAGCIIAIMCVLAIFFFRPALFILVPLALIVNLMRESNKKKSQSGE